MLALGTIIGGAANWAKEQWKGRNEAKKLSIEADQQEAQQALAVAPVWQDILNRVETHRQELATELAAQRKEHREQIDSMRAEHQQQIEAMRAELHAQTVQYARLDAAYILLQDRVRTLEGQLEQALQRHNSDAATIAALQAELVAAKELAQRTEDELQENILDLEQRLTAAETALRKRDKDLADADYLIATGPNQPDYTSMGGPPQVPATDVDTISDKPKGATT
jgi:hypothetical protein